MRISIGLELTNAKAMTRIILVFFLIVHCLALSAQELIPLWPKGKMPNSKGMKLTDSISNERIHRVGTPGMYAFFTSREENRGAAVLICPGGGYERLAYIISGTQIAKWFNTMGINAFVLNYRLPTSPDLKEREKGPLQDAQRALKIIYANAGKWKLDTGKIGIWGCSAGGHLASLAGTATGDISSNADSLDQYNYRPRFILLVSPVIDLGDYAHKGSRKNLLGDTPSQDMIAAYSTQNRVTAVTPPTFLVHAFNDKSVDPQNSLLFYQALMKQHISSSIHIFPQGGHAIALRNNPGSAEYWTLLCEEWLKETGILPAKK